MAASTNSALWKTAYSSAAKYKEWPKFEKIAVREKIISDFSSLVAPGDNTNPLAEPSDVLIALQLMKEQSEKVKAAKDNTLHKIVDKVLPVLIAIKDLGNAATALNPFARLGWGLLQSILDAVVKGRDVRNIGRDAIEPLMDLISRYQTFEATYLVPDAHPTSRTLVENALIKLFTSILKYHASIVIQIYSKSAPWKGAFGDISRTPVAELFKEVRQNEDEFLKLNAVVRWDGVDTHFDRLTTLLKTLRTDLEKPFVTIDEIKDRVNHLSVTMDASKRSKILNWISPIKFESAHNKPSRSAYPGTADWLFKHADYLEWSHSSRDSIFWLKGFMGSGKSCVAHGVIKALLQKEDLPTSDAGRVLYFYCDGTDAEASKKLEDVACIMQCLLKELADEGCGNSLDGRIVRTYDENHHKSDLSLDQCKNLISDLVAKLTTCFIVIDGLDECQQEVRIELLEALQDIYANSDIPVKLFISSRDEVDIEDWLQAQEDIEKFSIDISRYNKAPLSLVIRTSVENAARRPGLRTKYASGGLARCDEVIAILEKHAGGMFRWVELALQYLHSSKNYQDMTDRLSQISTLGGKLFELYQEIWQREVESLPGRSQIALKTALLMLLYGQRDAVFPIYLPFHESMNITMNINSKDETEWQLCLQIASACSFARSTSMSAVGSEGVRATGGFYSIKDVAALCPSLISVRIVPGSGHRPALYIPHFSVKEFLIKKHAVVFSPRAGHSFLASLCMQLYLNETPTSKTLLDAQTGFSRYAYLGWINHLSLLYATGYSSLNEALEDDSLLKETLQAFLLESFATPGFTRWNLSNRDSSSSWSTCQIIPFHTTPTSSLPARIALDIGWDDPPMPIEILDAKSICKYLGVLFSDCSIAWVVKARKKISVLAFAVMCRSVRAIEYLVKRGADLNGASNGIDLGKVCIEESSELGCFSLPAARASKAETLSCLIRHGYHLHPPGQGEARGTSLKEVDHMEFVLGRDTLFDKDVFDLLVARGYEPSSLPGGRDYFDFALSRGCTRGAETLAPNVLGTPRSPKQLATWLCAAVLGWHPDIISRLLSLGADPLYQTRWGTAWDRLMFKSEFSSLRRDLPFLFGVFTTATLGRGAKLWEPDSRIDHETATAKWSKYFVMVVAFGNLKTVMQWVSHGWEPTTWCDFQDEIYGTIERIGPGVETAYTAAQKAGRQDVIEYFKLLGVDLIHSEIVKLPLNSVVTTVNNDTLSDR
ncbi:hypothetical protein PV04_04541 [Phialophora macrospora]|uniref:Nephrocystin 3-like N-terminal domain-containing protein n=1 Tax=Phialophora macrospora TaxID=1851006 RepID=A0A0D2G9K1_9EURO|nr:hypothetical protein PV04_04541 [Phialophora macrospora]